MSKKQWEEERPKMGFQRPPVDEIHQQFVEELKKKSLPSLEEIKQSFIKQLTK